MNLSRFNQKLANIDEKALKKAVLDAKGSGKRNIKNANTALSEANELLKDPAKLRSAILARLNSHMDQGVKAGRVGKGKGGDKDEHANDGMTDEQKNLEQEKLFREAREQYDIEQMAAINTAPAVQQQDPHSQQHMDASNGATNNQFDGNQGDQMMDA